ncbi:histidine kinase [Microbacterium halophytorum]|uniref:histidine kinase n=1 Tax=Microbacterium halophytorum TaxID=2067568 RepID=UPI000CFCC071|nr:histidine kinase [Microbacterium halophytorum]
MSAPAPAPIVRTAAALLGLEALALAAVAVWELAALFSAGAGYLPTALALIVMTLIGVAGLAAFSWAVHTGRSWGRSGGVVAQLLVIAVAIGTATGEFAHPLIAVAMGVPAAATLVVLFLASRAASGDASPRR